MRPKTSDTTSFEDHSRYSAEFVAHANSKGPVPTTEAYRFWQDSFDLFNDRLFGRRRLPNTIITLTRHPRALGYFCAGSFENADGAIAHEISMNPSWFAARGDAATLSTLVHEMCHLCRHVHGGPNRKRGKGARGYHDAPWADIMESVGLMPSDTGEPGGRRTGFQMTHYIIEGGPFDRACRELLGNGYSIDWRDALIKPPPVPTVVAVAAAPAPSGGRTRFKCPKCQVFVEARKSARLACLDCNRPLVKR
jgi:hypothetical protein